MIIVLNVFFVMNVRIKSIDRIFNVSNNIPSCDLSIKYNRRGSDLEVQSIFAALGKRICFSGAEHVIKHIGKVIVCLEHFTADRVLNIEVLVKPGVI